MFTTVAKSMPIHSRQRVRHRLIRSCYVQIGQLAVLRRQADGDLMRRLAGDTQRLGTRAAAWTGLHRHAAISPHYVDELVTV